MSERLLLYIDEVFQEHETGSHPECPARLKSIRSRLNETGLLDQIPKGTLRPATSEQIALVHGEGYADSIRDFAANGGGRIDADTEVSPRSFDVAELAAGTATAAVDEVMQGNALQAMCLVRPPGHHARPQNAMGFCLFGNIAIAARHARQQYDLSRVLIIDWDVHHGNGTQEMFYDDPNIGFYSVHRWPFYPGTGDDNETGTGDGLGTTWNLPLEFGISRQEYLDRFTSSLTDFAAKMKPELVLLSAGFDAHRADPVGSLGLETEDFGTLTTIVQGITEEHCQGKLVSLLEGGYDLHALALSVECHLRTLLGDVE